jgi:DinB family protein
MNAANAIAELARQVRGATIQSLAACPPEWVTWAPPGTSNHVLWHAGHALWLGDVLCLEPLTGHSKLPAGWAETFGMNCRPVKTTTQWPSASAVETLLSDQLRRILAALEAADDAELGRVANPRGDTLAGRIIHGLHDEARQQGEMYLLTKLCRRNPP